MCIGVWTLKHPEYALILCTNRDEFLDRPTQNARFRNFGKTEDHPADILSGLDERAGGTWLGISRNGRVALLTNISEEAVNLGTSRGPLVPSFLLSDPTLPLEEVTTRMIAQDAKYSGFNLMLFAPRLKSDDSLNYEGALVTNHGAGGVLSSRPLSADEHRYGGISNGIDGAGATDWPKVKRVTQDFGAVLQSLPPSPSEDELVDRLMEVLAWRCEESVLDRSKFCNTVHVTPLQTIPGVPTFSGTRLSTVILVRRDGLVRFVERDIWQLLPDGKPVLAPLSSTRVFQFRLGINQGPV